MKTDNKEFNDYDDYHDYHDYHDYVIKDGQFVGEFESMYKNCDNPWPESIQDMEENTASKRIKELIDEYKIGSVLSLGSGLGSHLNWLVEGQKNIKAEGVELSKTAADFSIDKFPKIKIHNCSVIDFLRTNKHSYDLIIMREILWYVLEDIEEIFDILKSNHKGSFLAIELSFPDDQKYGVEYFHGISEFIDKFKFKIIEEHRINPLEKYPIETGYLMIFSKI